MKYKFYKGADGILFFMLVQFVFLGQILFVNSISDEIDDEPNKILRIHKLVFFIILFLTFCSHFRTSVTDPGSITAKNNKEIIEFYYYIHEPLIKRAQYITEKKTPEVIRKIIFEANDIIPKENSDYNINNDDNSDSEKDDYEFEPNSSINDETKKTISTNYRLKLTRCSNCHVVRPLNGHHCSICHICIMEQDHHCPWVNNCIGLFNKKYFALFNFYALISVVYSGIMFIYYSLYKNIRFFNNNNFYIIMTILAIIFGIIYGIFVCIMIFELFDDVKKSLTQCDYKNGILLEKSSTKQQFQIIFGGTFSLKWLLPFYSGGNNLFFEQMCKVIKMKKLQKFSKKIEDKKESQKPKQD